MQFSTAAVVRTAHHLAAINSNQARLRMARYLDRHLPICLSIYLAILASCLKNQAVSPNFLSPAPYILVKSKRNVSGCLVQREQTSSSRRLRSCPPPTTISSNHSYAVLKIQNLNLNRPKPEPYTSVGSKRTFASFHVQIYRHAVLR